MNGHYEIDNSNYPIGTMRSLGNYRVFDMRSLKPLHSQPISKELGYKVAALVNAKVRSGQLPQVADAPEVSEFTSDYIEKHQDRAAIGAV